MDVIAVNEHEDEQDDSTQLYVDSMNMCVDSIEEIMNNMKATLKPTMFLLHPQIIDKSLLELILSDAGYLQGDRDHRSRMQVHCAIGTEPAVADVRYT
jgi:hypothetical protein